MSDEDDALHIPIDDRKIFTEASEPTIKELCNRINKGKLDTQAEFQRNYVWERKVELKSKLIESVLLKVPIPIVYVAQMSDDKEAVVDGQQRLHTFYDYCKKDGFKLKKLKILEDLNGKGYDELPEHIQDKIDSYPIRVVKILKESHPDIKFDVFERLNKGSVKLNNQELRNCVYRGSFNQLLRELAKNRDFLKLQRFDEPDTRMKDVERILRFFAFVDRGVHNYKSPSKTFLNNYMEEKRDIDDKEIAEKTNQFKKCAELTYTVFGNLAGRRWMKDWSENRGSIGTNHNDGILDAQMVGFLDYEKHDVVQNAQVIQDAYLDLVCKPAFAETVEIGTYSTKQTKNRMDMWFTKLREVMGYRPNEPRFYTFEDKKRLFDQKAGNVCALCKNQIMDMQDAHVDHIVRYADGGPTEITNAQITHRYCNLSKG